MGLRKILPTGPKFSRRKLFLTDISGLAKNSRLSLVSFLLIYVKNYENNSPDLNKAIVKTLGNLFDLHISDIPSCVGFYFLLLLDIYVTDVLFIVLHEGYERVYSGTFQSKTNTLFPSFMKVNVLLEEEAEISTDQVCFKLS